MAQYSDINQVIKDLINNKNLTDTDILQYLSTEDKKTLWEKVAAFMESEGIKLDHLYPIWENDFTGNSLFKFLSENIDLDKSPNYHFTTILNDLKTKTNEDGSLNTSDPKLYPWNESLATAITYYLRFLSNARDFETQAAEYNEDMTEVIDTHGSINTDGELGNRGGFRVKSITTGDAGRSFTEKPWVRPNYNIDAETYDAVRGLDEMLEALKSNNEMQFTNSNDSSLSNYLRLLMPKYLRRVEVEDLNRNFWVIGQVLAAVCSYLFDPDSPITNEFKKILNEIVQLWENVLYLWVLFAIISQEDAKPPITDIHTEIVYLPNDKYRNFLKYDGFAESSSIDYQQLFGYLKQTYTESNLCIIPVLRDINYYRNYYAYEFYPRYITYNRNTDAWGGNTIGVTGNQIMVDVKNEEFPFPTMYRYIGAIREVENEKYNFIYPYSKVQDRYEKEPNKYYAILRTVPTAFTCAYENDTVKLKSLKVELHDVTTLCSSLAATRKIGEWTYDGTTLNFVRASSFAELSDEKNVDPAKGFYMGELSSYFEFTKQKNYNGELVSIQSAPIRTDASQAAINVQNETYFIPDSNDWPQVNSVVNQIHANGIDKSILKATVDYDKSQGTETFKKDLFKIYVSNRLVDIRQDDTKNPWAYKYIENNNLVDKNTTVGISFGNSIDTSAILYDSESDRIITYNDYSFNHVPGYWAYIYPSGESAYGWSSNVAQIWTRSDRIEPNNWCVKFVQATGVFDKKDSNGKIKYYDTNRQEQILDSSQYTYVNQWNQQQNAVAICSYVQVSLFYPDGTTAYKIFDRWGLNNNGQECLFFRTGSNWAVQNGFTTEELYDGKYWLTKETSNYHSLDPNNGGWYLFNRDYLRNSAPAGIAPDGTRISGLENYWDFSANPNCGYAEPLFMT